MYIRVCNDDDYEAMCHSTGEMYIFQRALTTLYNVIIIIIIIYMLAHTYVCV